jgi:chromosome segregation protein
LKKTIALGGETIKKLSRDIEVEEKRIEKVQKNAPKIDMSALDAIRNEKDNKEIEKNTLEERKRNNTTILTELAADIEKLEKEKSEFEEGVKSAKEQIAKFEGELKVLEKENEKLIREIEKLIDSRRKIEEAITKIEKESAQLSFDISRFNEEIGKYEVEKARIETELSGFRKQYEQYAGVEVFTDKDLAEVRKLAHDLERKINSLGNVNMRAIESFEALKKEIDEVNVKLETLKTERQSIFDFMAAVEQKKMETFMKAFEVVRTNFEKIYHELASGEGTLILDNPRDISESGLLITASPKGKKLMNIDLMSGGEKTLTTSAFLLAIQRYKPSHFYMVDELDAALDRENSARLAEMLSKSTEAQFLLITHNEALMKYAQAVIGISMVGGVSQIVGVKLAPAAGSEAAAVTA